MLPSRWLLIGLVAVVGLLWIVSLSPLVGDGYDDTRYIALAQAIAEGKGFCRPAVPHCQAEVKLPVGYPLLLAPVWLVWPDFPQNVWGFKLVSVSGGLLAVGLSYLFLHRYDYLSDWEAIIIAALTAVAPSLFVFATTAFSEAPYLAFSLLSLIALERYARATEEDGKAWLLAVLSSVFAFYLRSVGLALGAAGVLYFAFQKRGRKAWRFGLAFALGVLPWILRSTWLDGGQGSYLDQLLASKIEGPAQTYVGPGGLLMRVLQNLRAYALAGLPGVVLPSQVPLAHVNLPMAIQIGAPVPGVDLILSTLMVAGFVGHLLFRRRLLDFYLLAYLGICMLWPWEPLRLSVPLIPFLFYYLWFEGRIVAAAIAGRWPGVRAVGRTLIVGLVVAWVMGNGLYQARFAYRRHFDPFFGMGPAGQRRWQGLYQLFAWIDSNVPPHQMLASKNDDRLYLYTGRHTTRDLTPEGLAQAGVDYVVHIPYGGVMVNADLSWQLIGPMIEACPRAFAEVYTDPLAGIRVFRVDEELLLNCRGAETG